jgi:glutamate synthase (NADPH/NADH) large chain/glutamate synthase (ferredoxin)
MMGGMMTSAPGAVGLYNPAHEHDGCGIGFVARLDGHPCHEVLRRALCAVEGMEHRGGAGADPETGDGAGVLFQIPDALFRATCAFDLPPAGLYGVLMCFLPPDEPRRAVLMEMIEDVARSEGQEVLGWREVPVREDAVGERARACRPAVWQLFLGACGPEALSQDAFERRLYLIRRVYERGASSPDLYIASSSSRTVCYKGMLLARQLPLFYPDLADERAQSALAVIHSRFSTNTFPSWALAHPYRMTCHNGEINTLRGNVSWMRARESELRSAVFGDDLAKALPVVGPGNSDSASFDNVLELLVLAGRSLPHAAMMMVPEAWQQARGMPDELRGFYAFHSCLMEPWDGPAATIFTDGRTVGALLDRNGLRPGRWVQTTDGYLILGSESGLLEVPPEQVVRLGRLRPGQMVMADLANGRVVEGEEAKMEVARRRPYGRWHDERIVPFSSLPRAEQVTISDQPLITRQRAFGWSSEDVERILLPMACDGAEPTGSMGNDSALAVLSEQAPSLFSYFKQHFAQVTNPPIDPLRESVVMSLRTTLGRERSLLEESPEHAHKLLLEQPILLNRELEAIRHIVHERLSARTLGATWSREEGTRGLALALGRLCQEADQAICEGISILILSDRALGRGRVPIPSLLACAAVHNHLVRAGTRLRAGIVIESGEPREVHHFACLIGYGASAVNPYLMLEALEALAVEGRVVAPGDEEPLGSAVAAERLVSATGKGLLKVMSKMGISTIQSYRSAQIFEAVGLSEALVREHFAGTASRVGGLGLEDLAEEALERHARAYPAPRTLLLPPGGLYAWRRGGESHIWGPETVSLLQHAVGQESVGVGAPAALAGDEVAAGLIRRGPAWSKWQEFARAANEEATRRAALRGLMELRPLPEGPIDLVEVEPASAIVKRFCTGAMSLGSISREAHETLAVAMNRLGGRSNTGEGGEDSGRFSDRRRSAIKQVASGRFGVTIEYLVNADELQIKVAQGAKPGEGGQLPGHKVDAYIGSIRHTTPGVGLISPPPHHDIYSIEDLKQLIYDLRCANSKAQVSVKLVASAGVGTIAAGVAKAGADRVVIAGHDGGTGASPLSSIQSAGVPWEMGLAETQQTLILNDLRSRIVVQTDGQLKTGRDVVIAALLGADEMGFSTAPLIATGCIMMRACHLNTCPVGIATQDPELRRRFRGTPEHVMSYFFLLAEEVREILASLGLRSLDEATGRADLLGARTDFAPRKARDLDLSRVLAFLPAEARRRTGGPPPALEGALDWGLIEEARPALEDGTPVSLCRRVRNRDRCVGGLLSQALVRARGGQGLPEGAIDISFEGSAGQSFGAWLAPGISLSLRGDAQDYVGKGLSGGVVSVCPSDGMSPSFRPEENVIVGNTVLYGATSGRAFFAGQAGERFAVRNSGALAVVEGVGDHACEYMTGGTVVVLGPTGRNFAAGMSGGTAYVLDDEGSFPERCNMEMVGLEGLSDADEVALRALVSEHARRTRSPQAARLLEDWDEARGSFVKVMPHDYKRALEKGLAASEDAT